MFVKNGQFFIASELDSLLVAMIIGVIIFFLLMGIVSEKFKHVDFGLFTLKAFLYLLIASYSRQFIEIGNEEINEIIETKKTVIEFGMHLLVVISILESISNILETCKIVANVERKFLFVWIGLWILLYFSLLNITSIVFNNVEYAFGVFVCTILVVFFKVRRKSVKRL